MKTWGYTFILCFVFSALNAVSQNIIRSKIPGNNFSKLEFSLTNGDTVYKKYEKHFNDFQNNDSILYLEIFDVNKYWYVNRYEIKDGVTSVSGWQAEYDLNGAKLYDRFYDPSLGSYTVSRKHSYYPNGQVLAVVTFLDNKLNGNSIFYHNNGQLKHNLEYNDGKLWNVHAYYDQNGNPLDIGNFCEGDGVVNVYSATGKIIKIKVYRKGKVKSSKFVDRN